MGQTGHFSRGKATSLVEKNLNFESCWENMLYTCAKVLRYQLIKKCLWFSTSLRRYKQITSVRFLSVLIWAITNSFTVCDRRAITATSISLKNGSIFLSPRRFLSVNLYQRSDVSKNFVVWYHAGRVILSWSPGPRVPSN